MGRRAGLAAAEHAAGPMPLDKSETPERLTAGGNGQPETGVSDVGVVTHKFRKMLQKYASILKTQASLDHAMSEIDRLRRIELPRLNPRRSGAHFDAERLQILQLRTMSVSARLHCVAAATRTETRGAHIRLDHPTESDAWRRHIVLTKRGEDVAVDYAERACL